MAILLLKHSQNVSSPKEREHQHDCYDQTYRQKMVNTICVLFKNSPPAKVLFSLVSAMSRMLLPNDYSEEIFNLTGVL
jgi:hypothetical protein